MLKGKTAVITGGSRGLGEKIAYKLASMGADIAVIDIGSPALSDGVCSKCRDEYNVKAASYACDVSNFEEVKETVAKIKEDFGTIHILVNNAGITRDGLIAMMKEEDFDKVIAVNLKGAFNMIRHTAGLFIRNREGCIINIASVARYYGKCRTVQLRGFQGGNYRPDQDHCQGAGSQGSALQRYRSRFYSY